MRRFLRRPEIMPLIALAILLIFNLIFTPGFFSLEIKDGHLYGSLIDIIKRGTPLMFIALGMTLVIATGGTDISVGSVAAISGAVVCKLIGGEFQFAAGVEQVTQTPIFLAIAIALFVSLLCGLWNGFLVARLGVQAMVATMILQVAGRGIAQLITSGTIITVYYKPFFVFGSGWLFGLPFSIYVVSIVAVLFYIFTRKTSYGMYLEAAGSNRLASRFAGIKVQRVIWIAFAVCSLMAGIAGILLASDVKSADANNAGLNIELDAILACVIGGNSMKGGRFSLVGSIIGALIVQTLTTTIYMKGIPSETTLVAKAIVVILCGLIQSVNFKKMFSGMSLTDEKAMPQTKGE